MPPCQAIPQRAKWEVRGETLMSSDGALTGMTNIQELPGGPEHPINGYKVPANLLSEDTKIETQQTSTDREATRYLSAATQIDIGYAKLVVARVMNEPFRALAPTFGVDVPVVAKWALKALRTHARRDHLLAAIFVLIRCISKTTTDYYPTLCGRRPRQLIKTYS
jgi:hypothetical protein